MLDKNDTWNMFGCFGVIVAIAATMFFSPLIGLFFGWLAGFVIKMFAGDFVSSGLNLIFNTTRFTPDHIPMLTATFAVFGSYFKSSNTNNNNSK